jgi:hypothetical protein
VLAVRYLPKLPLSKQIAEGEMQNLEKRRRRRRRENINLVLCGESIPGSRTAKAVLRRRGPNRQQQQQQQLS